MTDFHFDFATENGSAELHLTDAAEYLDSVQAGSVDLIITSPPYFVGKEYDPSKDVADFRNEIRRVLPGMVRAIKSGGHICWQVGNHVRNGRLTPLDAIIIGELADQPELTLRNRIIWTFGHGAHASKRFSGRHETILWYSKGDDYYFDLDASRVPQLYPGKKYYKGPKKGDWSGNPLGKNPGDIWDIGDQWGIPNVKAYHIEKTEHPCQFPTALVRRLIVGLSPTGGTVLDPYMGSGTTAVAALLENRSVLGCDTEQRYLDIAAKRLNGLLDGSLQIRDDIPIRVPRSTEQVSRRPPHFPALAEAPSE